MLIAATPLQAGNVLMPAGTRIAVAKSTLSVAPDREWNRMGARPGRNSETWTIDGDPLNDLTFYGGIADGKTLFREIDKRNRPLPPFSATMLLTDIPTLFENSYRIALGTPLMTIETVEPAKLAGRDGVHFTYSFTKQGEDVRRRGEATAVIINKSLYMISFEAPVLHYFDAGIASYRQVLGSAALN
jgi:hypothetical protein